MKRKFFIKKRKPINTQLRHNSLYVVLPFYFIFFTLCEIIFAVSYFSLVDVNYGAAVGISIAIGAIFLIGSAAVIFIIIPALRVKQAKLDIKNYDFTPYVPTDEEEKFNYSSPMERYYFTLSPFDEAESVTLTGGKAIVEYFKQFTPERFLGVEYLGKTGEFVPFFISDFTSKEWNTGDNSVYTMTKTIDGDKLILTVTAEYNLSFASDGITVGEKHFDYSNVLARADAQFTGFSSAARIYMLCSDELMASFALGGRIVSLLKKYKISMENYSLIDYIMANPDYAFRQIALHKRLKNIK